MKKTLLLLSLIALLPFSAGAQQVQTEQQPVQAVNQTVQTAPQIKVGYLSYSEAIKALPDYAIMQKNLESLRKQYADETKRAENEFNAKYDEFLEGQKDFAPVILNKRQAELQELLNKNIAFKQEAARLLQQAEADMKAPLKTKLNSVLAKIARDRGLTMILNTDNDNLPFIDPALGEDINTFVQNVLKAL